MKPKEFMMKYSRILILVLIMVFVSAASLDFLKPSNLLNVARQSSMLLIMSLGMTCAMLLGQGVDMSIGATLSLTSCVAAGFLRSNASVGSVLFGIGIAILIGMFIGLINGALTAWLHLPAFLVTYGVREIIRSVAFFYMDGNIISGFHKSVMFMGSGFIFGVIPTQIVIAVVLTVATAWMLKHTRMGRELYIAGANPNAARFSGLKVEKSVILRLYAFRRTGCAGRYCIPGPPGSSRGRDWKSVPFSVCQCSSHWRHFLCRWSRKCMGSSDRSTDLKYTD